LTRHFHIVTLLAKFINDVLPLSGPEYGTMEAACKGILTEADRVSEMHTKIKDQLCNEAMQEIRVWQKDNFHKVSQNKN
jgi:hypothetical protein